MARGTTETASLTIEGWATTLARLDRIVADAARSYLQDLRGRGVPDDLEAWTRELNRLMRGQPTDYALPGLPLMYALRYMPKRVISLMGALSQMKPADRSGQVVDIGTGTGATVVAMQLLYPDAQLSLTGIDASAEMLRFARGTQTHQRSKAMFTEGTIESLLGDPRLLKSTEMVTFSAPFDRAFSAWNPLAVALSRGSTRSVLAAEPESRKFLLDNFELALGRLGWDTRRFASESAVPAFMKEDRALAGLTRFWRHLGQSGLNRPQTWWEPPADEYLIASRT